MDVLEEEYTFSELLRQFRARSFMTQQKLAESIGVTRNRISNWETGDALPKMHQRVHDLARVLYLNEEDEKKFLKAFLLTNLPETLTENRDFKSEQTEQGRFSLGARLRQARAEAGISLSEMAGRLGYTRSHISAVEIDIVRPSQELLVRYTEQVGRTVEDLTSVPPSVSSTSPTIASQPGMSLPHSGIAGQNGWRTAPFSEVDPYGYEDELSELKDWILKRGCRVVAVVGKAGMGKTTLMARLYNDVADQFDDCSWFSLKFEPSLVGILQKAILAFSPSGQHIVVASTEDALINQLLDCLSRGRYLLGLDGIEAALRSGNSDGEYIKEYRGLGNLIHLLSNSPHQSCLLLSSREQLKEMIRPPGKDSFVRYQQLQGLATNHAIMLLKERGLQGSREELQNLVTLYEGNPHVLDIVCSAILSLFSGNVDLFLDQAENQRVFGELRTFFDEQFARLSEQEAEIIYWLAIEQEATPVEELYRDLMQPVWRGFLFEKLAALQRRFMISMKHAGEFSLHSGMMEYAINSLVERMYREIVNGEIDWLARYALVQAQAKDYIREAQTRVMLSPLLERLRNTFSERILAKKLERLLNILRESYNATPGYAAGNILNILTQLQVDLTSFDFSKLVIRQAYLQHAQLPGVDFRNAIFDGSVFTDSFGIILSVTFSPDGSLLAAGTSHNEIRLWQTRNFTPLRTFYGHRGWVWSLAFSPDGQYLVSGSEDSTVRIWDMRTGQNLKTISGYSGWIRSLTFHQGGNLFAYGGDEKTIKLWTINTNAGLDLQEYRTLQGHESWIRSLAFSPDGTLLASGSEDQTIRIWNIQTGECIKTLSEHRNRVRSLAFSPDGAFLASCGEDGYARIWDMRNLDHAEPTRYQPPGEKTMFISVAFNPRDNTSFSTGEDNGRIWQWDVNKVDRPIAILEGHANRIREMAYSPDGTRLASGSEDLTLRLWDMKSARCIKTFQGYSSWMWSVVFRHNATTVISGGEDNTVRMWSVNEGKSLKTMEGHTQRIWSVAFSPQMDVIASGSEDQTVRLWKASTGQHLKTLLGHTHRVRSVAFTATGRVLASGSEDRTIRLWDVNTSDALGMLEGHDRMIWGIAFSKKGQLIASGSADETVRLWDAENRECIQVLEGHKGAVRAVAFNDDTSLVASGGDDHIVRIWDVKSGELRSAFDGHTDRIYSLAFSPHGSTLASGGHDQTIKIWEVNTGQCIRTLEEHTGHVWSVSFSEDGQSLASCSEDGTIRIWNVNDGTCSQVIRNQRPYEEMQIAGVKGLTQAQIKTLLELGAKESDF